MPETIVTWTAGNGSAIKIEVAEYLDSAVAYASVNGKHEIGSKPIMLDAPVKLGSSLTSGFRPADNGQMAARRALSGKAVVLVQVLARSTVSRTASLSKWEVRQ